VSAAALALVPKRFSLLELVADVDNITALVFALDDAGEMTPEIEEELQKALLSAIVGTKAKVDRTASVIATFEAAEAAADAEVARLEKRAAAFKRNRERLELYVLSVLSASKLDKLEGDTATLARRKNPGKVEIRDERVLPAAFWRFPEPPPPPAPSVDKKAIAVALKRDPDAVPGAALVQDYRLVRS
jgi:hypothetical protein